MKFPKEKPFGLTTKLLKNNSNFTYIENKSIESAKLSFTNSVGWLVGWFVVRSRAERTLPLFGYWMNISFGGASQFHSCTLWLRTHLILKSNSSSSSKSRISNSSSSRSSSRCYTNALCFPIRTHHRICTEHNEWSTYARVLLYCLVILKRTTEPSFYICSA